MQVGKYRHGSDPFEALETTQMNCEGLLSGLPNQRNAQRGKRWKYRLYSWPVEYQESRLETYERKPLRGHALRQASQGMATSAKNSQAQDYCMLVVLMQVSNVSYLDHQVE